MVQWRVRWCREFRGASCESSSKVGFWGRVVCFSADFGCPWGFPSERSRSDSLPELNRCRVEPPGAHWRGGNSKHEGTSGTDWCTCGARWDRNHQHPSCLRSARWGSTFSRGRPTADRRSRSDRTLRSINLIAEPTLQCFYLFLLPSNTISFPVNLPMSPGCGDWTIYLFPGDNPYAVAGFGNETLILFFC